jgi:subtilisin
VTAGGIRPAWSEAFDPVPDIDGGGLPVSAEWAFDGADGAGVRVAVVDSGIDVAHPAVAGPFATGVAFSWDADTRTVSSVEGPHDDMYGHGTACAGIIRRAAPGCELVSVRVLGARLSGRGEVLVAGLRWAIASGARVVNLSLSSAKADMFGLFHEVTDEAVHAGVVLVCAMNNVPALSFPSQFSSVISVAACDGTDPFRLLAGPLPPADFAAPGLDLEIPWLGGGAITATGNSFAAPHVTGLVARVLSKYPAMTPYQVKAVLRAVAANAAGDPPGGAGRSTP